MIVAKTYAPRQRDYPDSLLGRKVRKITDLRPAKHQETTSVIRCHPPPPFTRMAEG